MASNRWSMASNRWSMASNRWSMASNRWSTASNLAWVALANSAKVSGSFSSSWLRSTPLTASAQSGCSRRMRTRSDMSLMVVTSASPVATLYSREGVLTKANSVMVPRSHFESQPQSGSGCGPWVQRSVPDMPVCRESKHSQRCPLLGGWRCCSPIIRAGFTNPSWDGQSRPVTEHRPPAWGQHGIP